MEQRKSTREARSDHTPLSLRQLPVSRWSSLLAAIREPVAPTGPTESSIAEALDLNEFRVHYQLIVNGLDRPAGAEALLRWQRPGKGLLSASEFMPVVRSVELMRRLGDFVLGEVVAALPALRSTTSVLRPYIGMNVSAAQLQDRIFVGRVSAFLRADDTDSGGLVVELDDPRKITDWPAVHEAAAELGRIGVEVAIDDTGSEAGDLLYRDRCEATIVKLDRSLVGESRRWTREREVVEATVRLCRASGYRTIAKGIEDEPTQIWLRDLGVDYLQGFHIERPEPLGDLLERARTAGPTVSNQREQRELRDRQRARSHP